MIDDPKKRYWDSSAFLALIKNEPGRADTCERIIKDARAGRCQIYTSTLALTEVVKRRKGLVEADRQTEGVIAAFFKNKFLTPVPLDISIATRARQLIWDFPWLTARDAVHVATAIELKADVLEHYDDDDLGRVGQRVARDGLAGFPVIRHPRWVGQDDLFDEEGSPTEYAASRPAPFWESGDAWPAHPAYL